MNLETDERYLRLIEIKQLPQSEWTNDLAREAKKLHISIVDSPDYKSDKKEFLYVGALDKINLAIVCNSKSARSIFIGKFYTGIGNMINYLENHQVK